MAQPELVPIRLETENWEYHEGGELITIPDFDFTDDAQNAQREAPSVSGALIRPSHQSLQRVLDNMLLLCMLCKYMGEKGELSVPGPP